MKKQWKNFMLISFIAGIVLANLLGKEFMDRYGLVNQYLIDQVQCSNINSWQLLNYIVGVRLPEFLIIMALGFTEIYRMVYNFLYVKWGILLGMLTVSALFHFGIKAFVLMIAILFPHLLIYILAYFLLYRLQALAHESFRKSKRNVSIMLLLCLGIILIYMSGIALESYVNPGIIKSAAKIV